MKSQFLLAAPTSGSGKTTIVRGLMALLSEKGFKVQPFKCGPDYIDTKFHQAVCGRPSINLDTFMTTPQHVCECFEYYAADAEVCVVEGMMGLFDGYDREKGSSYEIARLLNLPVVLVVDAKSAAYSMAALLSGFLNFKKDIRFAGIIYNKVGSERHFQMLKQVCDDLGVECLGYLPKSAAFEQSSRYLGLDFSTESDDRTLIQTLDSKIDWKRLLSLSASQLNTPSVSAKHSERSNETHSVLIARNNESFSFLYQETLDRFEKVSFFDPEKDVPSFENIDLLYLPGGYPEKHLADLEKNERCRKAVKEYAEQGGRIVAECGGMMYLCKAIVTDEREDQENGEYCMCGVLPYTISARKADRKLSLGYRQFVLDGKEYRGHEFHYTQFLGQVPESIVQVYDAKGNQVPTPVFKYKNVLASYTHLYQL